jgi:hypothetical protein
MGVLHLAIAVQADAEDKVMLPEQPAPGVVQQGTVGLQAVADPHARRRIAALQRQRPLVKTDPRQQRLTALPDEVDLAAVTRLGGDVAADKFRQQVVVHLARPLLLALRVVTVAATQVAAGADRLHQQMKRRRRARFALYRDLLRAQLGQVHGAACGNGLWVCGSRPM